jgi:hypothetical protein
MLMTGGSPQPLTQSDEGGICLPNASKGSPLFLMIPSRDRTNPESLD